MASDTDALNAITAALSGNQWNADVVEEIATIVRSTGRVIEDIDL